MRSCAICLLTLLALPSLAHRVAADDADGDAAGELAVVLRQLDASVLNDEQRESASGQIDRDIRRRRDAFNERNRRDWYAIRNRQQWEAFVKPRIEALRASLGDFPAPPKKLNVRVTGSVPGDGFVIENLVYESRPGNWVTGNLYRPAKPIASTPGILIAHAHHRPKRQGELQDMGMTWARAGCQVLVIDQVGYGERRAHPFHGPSDYAKEYRSSRQDYYYRYDSGIQLQLAGDSLMGWMVWDWMRAVDLLLDRPGTDPKRIIMLGAVAGGGDPAGITAALDTRIKCCVPFNFGGPQPETRYPLPDDAEQSFNYLGGTYWESTRGLRRGAADGFCHWVITSSIAPRRLVHSHEFSWDRERDPVWARYEKIFGDFYGRRENLSFAHGKGLLKGRPPEASHCTNIGRFHRRLIHPAFRRWFRINVTDADEYSDRREPEALTCLTDAARQELKPKSLIQLVGELGRTRADAARSARAKLTADAQRRALQTGWAKLLGDVAARPLTAVGSVKQGTLPGAVVARYRLQSVDGVVIPAIVIQPASGKRPAAGKRPAVVAVAQGGKERFLAERSDEVARLVKAGWTVCLPDLRGTGETRSGSSRGRSSGDGNRSVNLLLYGETMLGQRLQDLRSVVDWLRMQASVDAGRISLWGDSFVDPNSADTDLDVPRGVSGRPRQSEPLGGLAALLTSLFDDSIPSVYVNRGLDSFASVLDSPHVLIPHDVVVPGVLKYGDVADLVSALAPARVKFVNRVDGQNRLIGAVETADAAAWLTGR